MSIETNNHTTYYHVNNNTKIETLDIGHSIDSKWDVKNTYPYYCLNYLLSGDTIIEIADKKYKVMPNQLFLIPPNTNVHYYSIPSVSTIEVYWVNFYGQDCEELIALTNFSDHLILTLPFQIRKSILSAFKETIELCNNSNIQSIVCTQFISNIIKTLLLHSKLYLKSDVPKKTTNFNEIITLINSNIFNTNLSASFICKQCYISPEYLSKLFKKNMGTNFSSYINMERIKKASSLLLDTDYPIKKIAETVGYGDMYYFCKIFKKYRLMTPSQYRRHHSD